MTYPKLKNLTKKWSTIDLYKKISWIFLDSESNEMYIQETFILINDLKFYRLDNSLFDDDSFQFLNGHTEYLNALYHYLLPKKEVLCSKDARFNFYQAHFLQVFNGLNHFLALLLKNKNKKEDIYFLKNIENAILSNIEEKVKKDNILLNHLLIFIKMDHYKLLWLLRNAFVHNYISPSHLMDMSFLLKLAIAYALTIYFHFKLIKQNEWQSYPDYVELIMKNIEDLKEKEIEF